MDSQNIHGIMLQLKSITEGINNHWAVWVSLAGVIMVGVAGIFQDRIRYWLCKPKLRVTFKESSIITDRNYGNIPHYNFAFKIENTGKSTLENAEALVSDIDGNREEKVNPVEFNLTWKDHGGTTIPRIPSNTYKFFNFGDILEPSLLPEGSFCNFPPPASVEFRFTDTGIILKSPEDYKIKIIFSANNVKPQIKIYKLKISNKWADKSNNLKEMISIKELRT